MLSSERSMPKSTRELINTSNYDKIYYCCVSPIILHLIKYIIELYN